MSAVTFEVISESSVEASLEVVWAMLTRFDRYGEWTRSLQIAGDVRRGAELAYIVPTVRADGSVSGSSGTALSARTWTYPSKAHDRSPPARSSLGASIAAGEAVV